jgi:hypothetical protein
LLYPKMAGAYAASCALKWPWSAASNISLTF